MTNTTQSRRGSDSFLRAVAISAIFILGATACSGGDSTASGDTGSSATTPAAKKATEALNAGLRAHADGDMEEAEDRYNAVLEHDATNKFAFYNLALIDESEGNYGLAEENYRSALEVDDSYAPALFNLAILRTDNDPEEAISLYERAVVADKMDAGAWLNLGLLLRSQGQERKGNRNVLRAIALDPSLVDPAEATAE